MSSLTSDQAPRSSERASVAEVWSTLSMLAKYFPADGYLRSDRSAIVRSGASLLADRAARK
jgi:hypothetical protein